MNFKVYTIPHTLFAAKILVQQLQRLGHTATLIQTIDPHDKTMHIIYGAMVCRHLPPNYVVMQTEVATSHHFAHHYLQAIARAKAVWDYSQANTYRYARHNSNISIVGPGIAFPSLRSGEGGQRSVAGRGPAAGGEVVFYGWLSPRREATLTEIQKHIPVTVVTNMLGPKMWKLLDEAKVVLNLHFYDNSPLELYRIHEAISHRCHVVSEGPEDPRYKSFVQFGRNTTMLINRINDCLDTPFNLPLAQLDNLEQIKAALQKI